MTKKTSLLAGRESSMQIFVTTECVAGVVLIHAKFTTAHVQYHLATIV
jgi:hypothetical protein